MKIDSLLGNEKTSYNFNVNSFIINAAYYQRDIDNIFMPLVQCLCAMHESVNRRIIVYLAGPGGAGKTTLSLLLETLIHNNSNVAAQAIGIDGFHYNLEYIGKHYVEQDGRQILMRDVRGSAETYDFIKLREKIAALQHGDVRWPYYDRSIHDVVEDFTFVNGQIVIIEGNWLLLDEPPWCELSHFCDYSVFVNSNKDTLINRLVERKVRGGIGLNDAKEYVMRSDTMNIERIVNKRLRSDMELFMADDGQYTILLN